MVVDRDAMTENVPAVGSAYLGQSILDMYSGDGLVRASDVSSYGFDVSTIAIMSLIRDGRLDAVRSDGSYWVKVGDVARFYPQSLTYECNHKAHDAYVTLMSLAGVLPQDALRGIIDGLSSKLENREGLCIIDSPETIG